MQTAHSYCLLSTSSWILVEMSGADDLEARRFGAWIAGPLRGPDDELVASPGVNAGASTFSCAEFGVELPECN